MLMHAHYKRWLPALAAAYVLALGLAACGGDDDDKENSGGAAAVVYGNNLDVSAAADGSFAYDQDSLEADSGSVTVYFDNPASIEHDVVIEDGSGQEIGKTDLVSEGKVTTVVDLDPGTYTYYCDVPGHREGGMEGTLTVN
jgi:plastocyanin